MKRFLSLLVALCVMTVVLNAKDYKYTTVAGDLTATRIYTLDNGLKVYLSVNKEKPRISSLIAVGTGSRNDPAETTGLAHYLEHLMFKGTNAYGTTNYAREKALLDTIEARYELYRKVTDPATRKRMYHEIDSISQLASQYNIPNEYDKLMASIGGQGTNAYTSNDVTCYTEDIPSNEVENWARIQSNRFMHMVIRGFHTELEAVYEEYNIGLAKDQWKMYDALYAKLFPGHPYGTQTTIGTQDHLKNPSITNIKNYFNNYYCPNNVAICLAGDMNPDEVIEIIDRYFGSWQPNPTLTRPEYPALKPFTAASDTTVVGQEAEYVVLGWRFDGAKSFQNDTVEVISSILTNGTAGMFDLNLNQTMKVMTSAAFPDALNDYSGLVVIGYPNEGQSLQEVRQLLLGEIAKLRSGDFDDNLLAAVVNNKKLNFYRSLDSNRNRTNMMVDAFINGKKWDDVVGQQARFEGMTKQQIVDFARRYLRDDNYVCVNKVQGEDTTAKKIDKPAITPIPSNRHLRSDFLTEVSGSEVEAIKPSFVNYATDMSVTKTAKGLPVLYKQNTQDGLFTLCYMYDFGQCADNRYGTAFDYMYYLGTKAMSVEQFKKKMYGLGCDYSFNCYEENIYITISGLSENMAAAVKLIEDYMANAKVDQEAWKNYVDMTLKARTDAKTSQEQCSACLRAYGIYGSRNSLTDNMSEKQLRSTNPLTLVNLVKGLKNFKHTVMYYGPMSEKQFVKNIATLHKTGVKLANGPVNKPYVATTTPTTEILIAPYEAKNIYMTQYNNNGRVWKPEHTAVINLFNEYFGLGMNGVVFQEIREARGLAYHASAYYLMPNAKGRNEYAYTYVITQNDKMMDCINQFKCIIDTLPQTESSFALAKDALTKQFESQRTTKTGVFNAYLNSKRMGLDKSMSEISYNTLKSLTMDDMVKFEQENLAGRPFRFLILGDEKELDMESLSKIAPIKRVTLEEIFGY